MLIHNTVVNSFCKTNIYLVEKLQHAVLSSVVAFFQLNVTHLS